MHVGQLCHPNGHVILVIQHITNSKITVMQLPLYLIEVSY